MQVTFYTSLQLLVLVQLIGIDTFRANKTTVGLCNTNQYCSVIREKFRSPVAHITKTLHNEFLASQTLTNP